MSRFKQHKTALATICAQSDWASRMRAYIEQSDALKSLLSPLSGLLARPEARWQAVFGLGLAVPMLAGQQMEEARVYMRRLMWSMNEESGNLGWGVPEVMGAILASSPPLAAEYGRILCSYGYQTGKHDNFIDYVPLRRGVYWGIGRLAGAAPAFALPVLPHLPEALENGDRLLRGMAAFALREAMLALEKEERANSPELLASLARLLPHVRQAADAERVAPPLSIALLEQEAIRDRPVLFMLEQATDALCAVTANAPAS